jgi:hypothetical protein
MKRILLLTLFLTGCISQEYDYKVIHPDVMYVGDSLCYKVWDTKEDINHIYENEDYKKTAQAMTGIRTNCVPGRKSTDITEIPDYGKPWGILFIALGTNDVRKTEIDDFRLQYQFLVYNANADIIYCVLPNKRVNGIDAEPYRQVILDTCANVIDPLDYGVKFKAKDTVHMTKTDHKLWARAINQRL